MTHRRVRVMADFVVLDGWNESKIIGDALSESEGVSFKYKVEVLYSHGTPVSDEDMGQNCDGCQFENRRCPCKACGRHKNCCELNDAELRSKCNEFDEFLGGDEEDPFDECNRCIFGEQDCNKYHGDADGNCRSFEGYQYDVKPDGDVYSVFMHTGKDDHVWVADFSSLGDAEMYALEKEQGEVK